jgi:uncharacterized membrane protein
MMELLLGIELFIVLIVVAGIVASNKGRSVLGWCVLVALIPAALAVLLALRPVARG